MTDQVSASGAQPHFIELAADIVSAFVSNNAVQAADLPALIGSVHAALQGVANPAPQPQPTKYEPAVPVKKSITPDALISLIDGKSYKSLKRHLGKQGLTPDEYRARFGLPRDYPMVAPEYAARRSELAKKSGLGQNRRNSAMSASTSETSAAKAPRKAGRKKAE